MEKGKKVFIFSLGFLGSYIGSYIYFYSTRNNVVEFSSEDKEKEELLRQYFVLKNIQNNSANRLKYKSLTKSQLQKELGYE
jgi:hypothetical protein